MMPSPIDIPDVVADSRLDLLDRNAAGTSPYAARPASESRRTFSVRHLLFATAMAAGMCALAAATRSVFATVVAVVWLSPVVAVVGYAIYVILTPSAACYAIGSDQSYRVLYLPRLLVWASVLAALVVSLPGLVTSLADAITFTVLAIIGISLGAAELTLRFRAWSDQSVVRSIGRCDGGRR